MIDPQITCPKSFLISLLVLIKSLIKYVTLEKWKKGLIVKKKIWKKSWIDSFCYV